ncbi:FxsA family protein [Pseudomonas cremoricolorata]|uniref:Exclusion suppressor FxsA n=1 Tax=Pseudomonas cremoricolorata TaxID=157783 RepID=A0A089WT23_9PSED|nr:FxsA family protein [Pseudomonas cremoricolorata]AIR89637.1 exclusion suppressor FxsA [Pseudomonas cremoricolorata]
MRVFLLLLLVFPVLELFVFVKVAGAIGFFPALLLIIAGSALGLLVMRVAGLATALRARESLQRGELPAEEMFQGMMLAIGGGLLLIPGFLSDIVGLVCLLPFSRHFAARELRARAEAQAARQRAFRDDPAAAQPREGLQRPNVIEGEYERRDQ